MVMVFAPQNVLADPVFRSYDMLVQKTQIMNGNCNIHTALTCLFYARQLNIFQYLELKNLYQTLGEPIGEITIAEPTIKL